MGTDQLLDLFELDDSGPLAPRPVTDDADGVDINGREEDMVDATGELREKGKKGVLDGLQELWDESGYREEYDIDEYLKTMRV